MGSKYTGVGACDKMGAMGKASGGAKMKPTKKGK